LCTADASTQTDRDVILAAINKDVDVDMMEIEERRLLSDHAGEVADTATDTDSILSDCVEPDYTCTSTLPQSFVEEQKFLVFEHSLVELFVRCPKPTCLSKVIACRSLWLVLG